MNSITNESITLDEIWRVFNEANNDGEYLLSFKDEEKITAILEKYAEAANDLHPRTEPVLPLQNVTSWHFLNDNRNNRILGFVVGLLIGSIIFYACL